MTDILQYDFFRNALAGLLIISVASALIGTYYIVPALVFAVMKIGRAHV